jgi:hypothetical protein
MAFSGGTYAEVARWLQNFLTSHAKREEPRAEVELEAGDAREGESYAARFRVAGRVSEPVEFAFREVADQRGSLAWCQGMADRARSLVRQLTTPAGAGSRAR